MEIYKVTFESYPGEDYYFIATSIKDAIKQAEKWGKMRRKEDEDNREFLEIHSVEFELETENESC